MASMMSLMVKVLILLLSVARTAGFLVLDLLAELAFVPEIVRVNGVR